jgi:deoxyribonuclease V
MGLASHFGIYLDVPTVGCAKSWFVGGFEEPGEESGGTGPLV